LRLALARGQVRRIRKGWVAIPDAHADVVRAVTLGGRLACMSAARHHGLWAPDDTVLHVGRPAHAGRVFGDPTGVVQHWQSPSWREDERPIESVPMLVRKILLCCDREYAIAVIDSALNQRKLTAAALKRILVTLPPRFSSILGDVDAASESGLESLCRVRLRNIGTSIRSQVNIVGVGRVDLLVGDRLVIEADGQAWHDGRESFHVDRTRDLALHRLGYIVIRVSYAHVMFEWMLVELAIRAIIGRREHLWSAAHRRDGLAG
jgi:very-short-patch-repair endonuclease